MRRATRRARVLALAVATAAVPAFAGALGGGGTGARVSQQVGTTEITVSYDSPSAQGRRIWGGVVPYDRLWVPSTDHPLAIQFSEDVRVADQLVPSGSYRLTGIPGRTRWVLLLEAEAASSPGAPRPPAAIRVTAPVKAAPFRERLTFLFSDVGGERASLDLEWERIRVSIAITTRAGERVAGQIKDLEGAWQSYANAARYMLETEKDFDAGLRYVDQSLALRPDWYTYWIKATLLAAKHDYLAAVEQGERARDLGRQQLGDGFLLEGQLDRTLAVWKQTPSGSGAPRRTGERP